MVVATPAVASRGLHFFKSDFTFIKKKGPPIGFFCFKSQMCRELRF